MSYNSLLQEEFNISPDEEDLTEDRLFKIIDLDEAFRRNPNARILNNDSLGSKKLSSEYAKAIYTDCNSALDFVPSCQCGNLQGVSKEGLTCNLCGTQCSSQFVDALQQNLWIGIPDSMPPVMHPTWYQILANWSKVGRRHISILDIILNPEEEVPPDLLPYIKGRGFRYFYEHIDEILDMLFYQYPKTSKKANVKLFIDLRRHYRNVMFTRHLPILHSSLHPLKGNGGTLYYADACSKEILAAVIDLSAETFREHATIVSSKKSDKALFDIYTTIVNYYTSLVIYKLGKKTGLIRKHNFGSRIHFSFRTVVSPQKSPLPMDEVLLPWGIMVQSLKFPILNFLMHRQRYSMENAYGIFMNALTSYDKRVDDCMRQYIDEYPGGKIAIALGRNPTMAMGSIMLQYVRDYKRDPSDETIAFNACDVSPANIKEI